MPRACQRCGETEDPRELLLSCGYDMRELKIPFGTEQINEEGQEGSEYASSYYPRLFYTLDVCKECRADWMRCLEAWFLGGPLKRPSPVTGIFVREYGGVRELTEEEWAERFPGREPFRVTTGLSPGKIASLKRPANYWELSGHEQWEIDKALGILDWDGK